MDNFHLSSDVEKDVDQDPIAWVARLGDASRERDAPVDPFFMVFGLNCSPLRLRRVCDYTHTGETPASTNSRYAHWPVDWHMHFDPDYNHYAPTDGN